MFVTKKTVVTSAADSELSKSIDDLMGKGQEVLSKGMEMLDSIMKVMEEAVKEAKTNKAVTTTIRIRLALNQIEDLHAGTQQTFKAGGTTIRLEREKI